MFPDARKQINSVDKNNALFYVGSSKAHRLVDNMALRT
jgi:hypothetical protein